jgi:methylase of polypeptide subunit release factors
VTPPELPPIDPALRQRLTDDILNRGILIPVIQAEDGEILDGRLRLEIAQEHHLFCPRIIVGKLSPTERTDLRLCVNLYRRHLNREQVRELIAWELRQKPEASDTVIGNRVGVDHKTVGSVRGRLEAGGEIPRLGTRNGSDGKRYPSSPKPIVITSSDAQAREASRLLDELGNGVPDENLNMRDLRTLKWQADRDARLAQVKGSPKLGDGFQIFACDFRKLGGRIEAGTVDFLLTDPPWEAKLGPELAEVATRLLKPDGILACSTGVYYMPYFLEHFRAAGLRYEWTVAEVHRFRAIRNAGQVKNQWTPVLVFRNGHEGRLRLNGVLEDVARSEECDKSLHAWQQDVRTSVGLIRSLCPEGGLVADVCLGSGSTAVATVLAGEGRRFAGCEIDARLAKAARGRVAEALGGVRAESDAEFATV